MSQAAATTASGGCRRCCDVLGWISVPLRWVLGGLFLLAAYHKLIPPNGPRLFSVNVQAFDLGLKPLQVRLATGMTPWIEVVCGICLLLGVWTRAAAVIFAGLLLFFIILLVSVLTRGLNLDCGCFGDIAPFCGHTIGTCHIVQDGIMLAAAVVIALTPRHKLALTR